MRTTSLSPIRRFTGQLSAFGMLVPAMVATIFFSGCVTTTPHECKGPPPMKPVRRERAEAPGWLKAYTAQAWESVNDEPPSYVHSDYRILSPEGRMIMHVRNIGPMNEPETIRLDPGNYTVVAQASGKGTVRRSVTIETGRTTVLQLDNATPP